MLTSLKKSQFKIFGEKGLPENYPSPSGLKGLLFYIQRNLNMNTVVYVLNQDLAGLINETTPLKVYWLKYTSGGNIQELNYIQNKLAFGYTSEKIDNHTFEISMVSYNKLRFFLALNNSGGYNIITRINGKDAYLNNIYVYADELGLFPDVKYIELYGTETNSHFPCYEKILI
ncbi:MAG: DUF4833 domain-containing protein [Bacteroidia bacterium]|nr:DUF4833 domain-containing protein [Bacteroidia bacterium]MBT8229081.1 DUF4833 domain-containing protein [Bacteroidia bacterium]NNK89517.1 DUF4833 domain-containing protein [Saprospiraceae bacterium]